MYIVKQLLKKINDAYNGIIPYVTPRILLSKYMLYRYVPIRKIMMEELALFILAFYMDFSPNMCLTWCSAAVFLC